MKNINIILASSNKGKIKEIHSLLPNYQVIPYSDILGSFEIAETGSTFKENAIIKAKTIHDMLIDINYQDDFIVISDDSGISVPALNGKPGIYSARYAGENATDSDNLDKLISDLKQNNISKTEAFYTASLAIAYNGEVYTTHGWMYGDVIDNKKGDGGFGYDPMFIPNGFDKTLGQLDYEVKKELSHRTKALNLALKVITSILK